MGYLEFNDIEDLIFNKSFQDWVLARDPKETALWEDWLRQHPGKKKLVNDAKAVVYACHINFSTLSPEEINAEIRKIFLKLKRWPEEGEEFADHRKRRPVFSVRSPLVAVAASLVLVILSFLIYSRMRPQKQAIYTPNFLVTENNNSTITQTNDGEKVRILELPDGSRISLEKGASLEYNRNFSDTDRKVYLVGEAFFDIQRMPSKPFFVFTSSIITKVLGTSFRVKAYATDKKAVVTVRTGKVSVFKAEAFAGNPVKGGEREGIVVTPNQTIVYNQENKGFNKTVTEKPVLMRAIAPVAFVFDGTPVSKVFKTMQEAYSIPIIYDEEVISSCSLSAKLGNESFFEKLDIICKAINATYENMDGTIIITAHGCR